MSRLLEVYLCGLYADAESTRNDTLTVQVKRGSKDGLHKTCADELNQMLQGCDAKFVTFVDSQVQFEVSDLQQNHPTRTRPALASPKTKAPLSPSQASLLARH